MEERCSIIKLENYGKEDLMKRYFRWDDDIVGTMYIEVNNGYATKQIAVTSNKYIASNRKDETHHFYLT